MVSRWLDAIYQPNIFSHFRLTFRDQSSTDVYKRQGLGDQRVLVTILGPFTIKLGERNAGPWYRHRPSASAS